MLISIYFIGDEFNFPSQSQGMEEKLIKSSEVILSGEIYKILLLTTYG